MTSVRDKDFYNLTVSVHKALNPMEAPLKMKHARATIITTHRMKETESFWTVIMQQPLMEHRFTAWKFCHLFHKVLREGHHSVLKQSLQHRKMLIEMGKLWGHLKDGVGCCIQSYSRLLVTKLEFHDKNRIFNGCLSVDFKDIVRFAEDDVSFYFQLAIEIFDYLDEISKVQVEVLNSIKTYRISSMTPQGQCRLAPLICLVQESNPLYDISVRLMFKLHDKLPHDVLSGHRTRFLEIFMQLKKFYDNIRPLQYFADLIQVPHLPDNAPNFSSAADFGSYTPPVVVLPEEPEPPSLVNLIETDSSEQQEQSMNLTVENELHERDMKIHDLENQIRAQNEYIESLTIQHRMEKENLCSHISKLETQTFELEENLNQLSIINADLESNFSSTTSKVAEEEQKAKHSEEKFTKFKEMYTQIRQEHISLLRQHGESTKLLNKEKEENAKLKTELEEYQKKVSEVSIIEQQRDMEKQTAQAATEELRNEIGAKETEIHDLKAKISHLEKELLQLEPIKSEVDETKNALAEVNRELFEVKDRSSMRIGEFERAISDKEAELFNVTSQLNEVQQALSSRQNELEETKNALAAVNNELIQEKNCGSLKIKEFERTVSDKEAEISRITDQLGQVQQELSLRQNELQEKSKALLQITSAMSELESELRKACEAYEAMKSDNEQITIEANNLRVAWDRSVDSILHTILTTMAYVNSSAFVTEEDEASGVVQKLQTAINDFKAAFDGYCKNQSFRESLVEKAIILGCQFLLFQKYCFVICKTAPEIRAADDLLKETKTLNTHFMQLIEEANKFKDSNAALTNVAQIERELTSLGPILRGLTQSNNTSLADLVERELNEMDKIIQDATEKFLEMMQSTKSEGNELNLQVNEKILDACTQLMKNIQVLIKTSRVLQAEIVALNKGSASVKEFYNRNSQWTEGLISASKSVAKAANYLVNAADKSLSNESKNNFEIIVAAQEIAACTAQLVIASKVKSQKDSLKLLDLTKASKSVSQATGAVVALVRNHNTCLENYEEQLDLNKLTASQAKTMEMEINVKCLELEQALQMERMKLSTFRKHYYANTEEK